MKNRSTSDQTTAPRKRIRRRASTLAAAVALVGGLAGAAGSAGAASTTPGDFSSLINPNVKVTAVRDCVVEVGHVVDIARNYSKIGGVRINCFRRHSRISATVVEQWYNPATGRLVNWGTPVSGSVTNSYGFGQGTKGILKSNRYCGAAPGYAWVAKATVTIDGVPSGTYYSSAGIDRGGC